jgi:anhydro-N-acetylmuramic acid kinase
MKNTPNRSRLVLGLMSGTSADGIDVALVRIPPEPPGAHGARLQNFTTVPFPPDVRAAMLRLGEGAGTTTQELSRLNVRLGQVFADAALRACRNFRITPGKVALLGSHGQTVYHQGVPATFLGASVHSTLQIGEPAVIAALTGITTVADFRPADMAVGGQGAPLVPWVDYLLYHNPAISRAALNIGGITNVTVIPRSAKPEEVFAFDAGPGNMLPDGLVRHFTKGRRQFDKDARMAQRGRLLPALLDEMLADTYLRLPPPKTAGREQYGEACLQRVLAFGRRHRATPDDLVRTVTVLTPLSIVDAINRWVWPRVRIQQLVVSGGGARNPLIMTQLSAALPQIEVVTSDALGLPGDAKEAFAFALLANETAHMRPSNLRRATGASRPAILGKICYAPPR